MATTGCNVCETPAAVQERTAHFIEVCKSWLIRRLDPMGNTFSVEYTVPEAVST